VNEHDWMVWAWGMTLFLIVVGAAAWLAEWWQTRRERRLLPPPADGAVVGQTHKPWM